MRNKSIWFFFLNLLSIFAGVIVLPKGIRAEASCQKELFDLPLRSIDIRGHNILVVDISIEDVPAAAAVLDTGAAYNVIFGEGKQSGDAGKEIETSPPRLLKVKEFKRSIAFRAVPVAGTYLDYLSTYGVAPLTINPSLINESGYTVVDILHKRLVGFEDEASTRACYGYGTRAVMSKDEIVRGTLGIEARINSTMSGRVNLDTGRILSSFAEQILPMALARKAPEWAYRGVTGENNIPLIVGAYEVEIGGITRQLKTAEISGKEAGYPDYIGILGLDVLDQSILILPPRENGYWELSF